jgi:hypothetical protein
MRENYINAVATDTEKQSVLCRLAAFFDRQSDTINGFGAHYIVDLFGTGATKVVSIVCENHDIPVIDLSNIRTGNDPIRDIVQCIMETSPPRCAIILDTRENIVLQKVRTRIINMHCDLRFRRVVFCLTNQETGSANCIQVPGSTDDKLRMLLYHVPDCIRGQAPSLDSFRPLAEAMIDYDLFEKEIWKYVHVNGTLKEFLSTALYQVVRRVRSDPGVDDGTYPTFEVNWRREIAPQLRRTLSIIPDALCPSIHRVIPIGVSSSDALQAMEVAIPKNIRDPYAITVQSCAVDDQCGSIAITQPMQYTVININCLINPGILVDVCRELRTGHRAVVSEVHAVRKELSALKSVLQYNSENDAAQLAVMTGKHTESSHKLSAVQDQLSVIQHEMTTLVSRLTGNNDEKNSTVNTGHGGLGTCSKTGCDQVVTKRFRSGKIHRQCSAHHGYAYTYSSKKNKTTSG